MDVVSIATISTKRIMHDIIFLAHFNDKCSTFRKDCPAKMSLRTSEDGMALVVRSYDMEHNHVISRVSITAVTVLAYCACMACMH